MPTFDFVPCLQSCRERRDVKQAAGPVISKQRSVFGGAGQQAASFAISEINHTIMPMTDRDHWGAEDRWDLPTDGYGDCEDYQLPKRKLLIDAGLPRRALRMTVVMDDV